MTEDIEAYKKEATSKVFFKDKEGRYQAASVQDVQLPDKVMAERVAEKGWDMGLGVPGCEHHWISHMAPRRAFVRWVQVCSICGQIHWDDLNDEIQRWREGLHRQELPGTAAAVKSMKADEAVGYKKDDGSCSKCTRPWDEMHEKRRAAYEKGVSEINALLPKADPFTVQVGPLVEPKPAIVLEAREEMARRLQHEKWIQNG